MPSPTTFVQGSEELKAGRANLQVGVNCCVCKKYFKDPVTIECRHNFCLTCISEFWNDVKDSFLCPVYHLNCSGRNFRSNEQLGKVTEVAMPLPVRKSKKTRLEGERSCEMNQQRPAISYSNNGVHRGHFSCDIRSQATSGAGNKFISIVHVVLALQTRKLHYVLHYYDQKCMEIIAYVKLLSFA
ncbi:hypothetical protein STEG23_029562 [Scotinomys teguina]